MPKYGDTDAEEGDVVWEVRRRSGSKSMQRVMFNDSPESDGDAKFHNNWDNSGGGERIKRELRIRKRLSLRKNQSRKIILSRVVIK